MTLADVIRRRIERQTDEAAAKPRNPLNTAVARGLAEIQRSRPPFRQENPRG